MSLNNLVGQIPAMQAAQQQMLESVLKPRGKIAESLKNKQPGQRLNEFYAMNPNMRPGEFDPSGAIAQSRGNFQAWAQDQMARRQAYNDLSGRPQTVPTPQGSAGIAPTGAPVPTNAQPASVPQPLIGPPRSAMMPQETAQGQGRPRINPLTGLPMEYNPGDNLIGFDPSVQQAGRESVARTNATTNAEVARRNEKATNYNKFVQSRQPQAQFAMGPDGQMYPKAMPVQGADARISPEQFNAAGQRDAGGSFINPNASGLRMEFMRQNGIGGVSPSLAGDVNKPTPSGPAMMQLIDPAQFQLMDQTQGIADAANLLNASQPQGNVQPLPGLPSAANLFSLPLMGDSMPQQAPASNPSDMIAFARLLNMSPVGGAPAANEPKPNGIAKSNPKPFPPFVPNPSDINLTIPQQRAQYEALKARHEQGLEQGGMTLWDIINGKFTRENLSRR